MSVLTPLFYHVVVGNPPYITVKDQSQNDAYRAMYGTCYRQYSLGVPFTQRFWELAFHNDETKSGSGFIGLITSNSFMKRESGKKLIEEFFPTCDLTHVVDTSGAYIPGHGTPTVILFGRNPWYRLLRHEVESLVRDKSGQDHLHKKKLEKELADLNTEARKLTIRLKAIERRRAELTKELDG